MLSGTPDATAARSHGNRETLPQCQEGADDHAAGIIILHRVFRHSPQVHLPACPAVANPNTNSRHTEPAGSAREVGLPARRVVQRHVGSRPNVPGVFAGDAGVEAAPTGAKSNSWFPMATAVYPPTGRRRSPRPH